MLFKRGESSGYIKYCKCCQPKVHIFCSYLSPPPTITPLLDEISVYTAHTYCRTILLEKPDIVVATPSRVLAHLKEKVSWLV